MAGGARPHAQDIFGECGVLSWRADQQGTSITVPSRDDGNCWQKDGGRCVVLHLGRGRHIAGFRKLETMGSHMHPHPHVSRFLGSASSRWKWLHLRALSPSYRHVDT